MTNEQAIALFVALTHVTMVTESEYNESHPLLVCAIKVAAPHLRLLPWASPPDRRAVGAFLVEWGTALAGGEGGTGV